MIRHAAAAAFPVGSLVVAVIEPSLLALLVLPVGGTRLSATRFLPASLAAIPVAPVTVTTDPEHRATANTPANSPAQELLSGPHPRPIGGTGQPRPVMAISIPSADDVGLFFRVGAKNPIAAYDRGFPFPASAPRLARASASLTDDDGSTSRYRRSSQKNAGPEAYYPLSLFPLCGAAQRGLFCLTGMRE